MLVDELSSVNENVFISFIGHKKGRCKIVLIRDENSGEWTFPLLKSKIENINSNIEVYLDTFFGTGIGQQTRIFDSSVSGRGVQLFVVKPSRKLKKSDFDFDYNYLDLDDVLPFLSRSNKTIPLIESYLVHRVRIYAYKEYGFMPHRYIVNGDMYIKHAKGEVFELNGRKVVFDVKGESQ